jgi:hypothetical protein
MVEPRKGHVHVVSEHRDPLEGALVEVLVDGRRERSWTGDVAADAVTYVGRLALDRAREVVAVLEHPHTGRIENRYRGLLLESVRRPLRR